MATGCEPRFRVRPSPFSWVLAVICVSTGACQAPPRAPFSTPQPQPDWSDPERQGKATVAVISSYRIEASRPQGFWSLLLRVRVVASSGELSQVVADAICSSFMDTSPRVATLRYVGGGTIQLSEPHRPWITFTDPMIIIDPVQPYYPAKQLPSGEWAIETPTSLIMEGLPTGEIEIAIDGEALRRELIRTASPKSVLHTIPTGGLTAKTSVFTVPAPKPETPAAPPTSGAGIGG